MGIVSKIGLWLDKHFPEKVSTDEVYARFAVIARLEETQKLHLTALDQIEDRLAALEKKIEMLTSENTALKAQAALRTRIASSIPMPGR